MRFCVYDASVALRPFFDVLIRFFFAGALLVGLRLFTAFLIYCFFLRVARLSVCACMLLSLLVVFCAWCFNWQSPFYYCPYSWFFAHSVVFGVRLYYDILIRCFRAWCVNWSAAFYYFPYSLFFACGVVIGLRYFTTISVHFFLRVVW